ncbi:MAG TPA: ABC transporter permease [Blastocatellia bacterium]|nr:ABC transporter permease [Blastocatellia bacterium]
MLLRTLAAEALKLKRTLALWMVLCAPMVIVVFAFIVALNSATLVTQPFEVWKGLVSASAGVWAVFMLPLFITLETALMNGIEHNARSWKHIYSLPISGWAVYAAKTITALSLVALSSVVLGGGTILSGILLELLKPAKIIKAPIPWQSLSKTLLLIYLAALFIIAIHTWVSMRWSSFALAIGVGVVGTFFTLFASGASFGKYYPWLLPLNVNTAERQVIALILGIAGGLLVTFIGCWHVTRRDVL